MTAWQLLASIVHGGLALAIMGLCLDLMRQAKNRGKRSDNQVWGYYMVLLGAFGYLIEPLAGLIPTASDILFEAGVLTYLVGRTRFFQPGGEPTA